MSRRDDDLAYGEYNEGQEGDRGLIGDMGRRFGFGKKEDNPSQSSSSHQGGGMSFFKKIHDPLHGFVSDLKDAITGDDDKNNNNQQNPQAGTYQQTGQPQATQEYHQQHRFSSFAPERHGNETKWYVDGCSYMYAVSIALERAKESIWILDWWLSPELYLRRPPAKNQQYRVDRMLHAAAERGVKVNIIVYKEVTQALTLSSSHTKHHLEDLHPNIGVFRHPDHLPDAAVLQSSFFASMKNMSFTPASLAQLPGDGLKAIYGAHEGTVMYWAHHEKLCLIDGHIAFMGGLDLCYGRWDTNQHAIADAHPGNIDRIVFPGQDFNNARMMDFQDVSNWENNKLDRTQSSRMGWSDVALCLSGPVVQDLRTHFTQRWNFIYDEKYSKKATRYSRLPDTNSGAQESPMQQRGFEGEEGEGERGLFGHGGLRQKMYSKFEQHGQEYSSHQGQQSSHAEHGSQRGGVDCQITRSSAKWSHNLINTEHSIQNAYCEIIRNSKHFIYIENQFFITATGDQQKPIKNQIGAAIVERIVRAARNGEKYRMIIAIPAVPAFAGDLKLDEALGTRAIMEFQYDSINRGGHSIYEEIAKAGVNPMDYIRFYNLRSYDRINSSSVMREAEERSGVSYTQAQQGYDATHDSARDYQAYRPPPTQEYGVYEMEGSSARPQYGQYDGPPDQGRPSDYDRYQQEAVKVGGRQGLGDGRWDTVSECYMLGGEDIRNVPWEGSADAEMDAFVSEELYIHSKLLIADDQTVICGSANLNDRSQLGDHDSEIAIIIQDPKTVESYMDGQPWRASEFAASLRREIFRKHLGLLKPQDMERPNANYEPVGIPNQYDWGSPEDRQVVDPLSDEFWNMWNWRAHTNTQAFGKVFHPVPTDEVKNWKQYDQYYSRFFGQDEKAKEEKKPSLYKWGHVVAENFSPGEQGVREVKEILSTIKGNLVEMPLLFLKEEDIAKEGVGLNALTEEIYT
jgi:phospholipase D1/2